MTRTTKFLIGGGAVLAVAIGSGVTIAVAQGSDDSEPPITGDALDRATQAALAHTGGGEVTDTEVGDEDSYYEVEVTLDDGSQSTCNSTTASTSSAVKPTAPAKTTAPTTTDTALSHLPRGPRCAQRRTCRASMANNPEMAGTWLPPKIG